ncbi:hypothetical protein R3W88_023262 [Solanum pinnatisectum]|uniref:Uncharacterized protein n=1 Tax=Solanum pinnatisectum TaxID=50273 RepID=A0AAV9LZ44_9SOLN|nr:hypothetical protein R3W88_023262 [Solanum pinnatisectum]
MSKSIQINGMWSKLSHTLENHKNTCKELAIINHRLVKQIQYYDTKATHLSMFYVIYLLIIFLSNSKPSPVQCKNWWKPFSFSILVALTFGANFISTVLKSIHIKNALDMNWIDQGLTIQKMANLERAAKIEAEFMDHQRSCNHVVKLEPHSMSSDPDTSDQKENYVQLHHVKSHVAYSYTDAESSVNTIEDLPRTYSTLQQQYVDGITVFQQYAKAGTTVSFLLAYTVLVLYGCRSSVCDDGNV